jgi:hypothetical protein
MKNECPFVITQYSHKVKISDLKLKAMNQILYEKIWPVVVKKVTDEMMNRILYGGSRYENRDGRTI